MQLIRAVIGTWCLLEFIEHDVLLELNVYEHGIEHDVDSAYGVCIHCEIPELYSKFHKYLAT